MAEAPISLNIEYFPDPSKGIPISSGSVYVGQPDTDPEILANRVSTTVIQEDGTRVTIAPASQPFTTGAGGVILYQGSPVVVIADGTVSVKVLDSLGVQKYYVPFANEFASAAVTSESLILNGSFEDETQFTGRPDNWTIVEFTNGTVELDNTSANVSQGTKSLKFTSAGLGGGTATSNKFTVEKNQFINVAWALKSSVANVRNIVAVNWYNSTDTFISSSTIYDDSATNPTSFERYVYPLLAPADAATAEVVLTGCDSSVATIGSTWFDNVVATQEERPIVETVAFYEDDFVASTYETTITGTANLSGAEPLVAGWFGSVGLVLDTGAAANAIEINFRSGALQLGSGEIYIKAKVRTPANLSDATDNYRMGILYSDGIFDGQIYSNGIAITYNHAEQGGNWQTLTEASGVQTLNDSGVTVAVDTDYIFEIRIPSDGTEVNFYIDGILVQTHTTNIPSFLGNYRFGIESLNAGTPANTETCYSDYAIIRQSIVGGR